jgi:hypothetical protein
MIVVIIVNKDLMIEQSEYNTTISNSMEVISKKDKTGGFVIKLSRDHPLFNFKLIDDLCINSYLNGKFKHILTSQFFRDLEYPILNLVKRDLL